MAQNYGAESCKYCKYHIIHSPQGFSGIIYNSGWQTARLLKVPLTSNEGMSNDALYMSVKVRKTTTPGTTCPTLYEECVGSLTSHRFIACARACEKGPTVYRPYPRRLESQTFCRCY